MKQKFEEFLIQRGYRKYTANGNPSTVYDYIKRIDTVCQWEKMDWRDLAENIEKILHDYEKKGAKSDLGAKSHNAVRCALRCFRDFIADQSIK